MKKVRCSLLAAVLAILFSGCSGGGGEGGNSGGGSQNLTFSASSAAANSFEVEIEAKNMGAERIAGLAFSLGIEGVLATYQPRGSTVGAFFENGYLAAAQQQGEPRIVICGSGIGPTQTPYSSNEEAPILKLAFSVPPGLAGSSSRVNINVEALQAYSRQETGGYAVEASGLNWNKTFFVDVPH